MAGKWDWLKDEMSGFSMVTQFPTLMKFLKGKVSGPDDMIKCSMCPNMCRHACPISIVDGKETTSPAGKSRVGMMLENEVVKMNEENMFPVYMCLSCGCCEMWCPFDFSVSDILRPKKKEAVEKGVVFDGFEEMFKDLEEHGTIYGEMKGKKSLPKSGDTLYLRGCEYRDLNSGVVDRTLEVLDKSGVDPFVLSEEVCCGIPAYNTGNESLFKSLAKKMSQKIEKAGPEKVVTSCPSCAYAYRELYPEFDQDIDIEILHIAEFLEENMNSLDLKRSGVEVTFHDPCKLVNGLGKSDCMDDVLKGTGLKVQEPRRHGDKTFCCGSGGTTVSRLKKDLSSEIAEERLDELKEYSDKIVTSCPTCKKALEDVDGNVKVYDISEIFSKLL